MNKKIIFGISAILLVLVLIFVFFVYSGGEIEEIPKPEVNYDENGIAIITEDHITYLIHYLGGQKLRNIPFTKNYPEIEVLLPREKTYFSSKIIDGEITTSKGSASDPDLQIRINENDLADIIKAQDPKTATTEAIDSDKIGLTLNSGSTELFLKGYFKIYDKIKP